MNKKLFAKNPLIFILLFFLLQVFLMGNTRVAFSRPSALIRTPSLLINAQEQEYHVGFSNELINTDGFNSSSSIYFKSISNEGFEYGIAYSSHANINASTQNPPSDLSLHFNKKIYEAETTHINVGVNDILYSSTSDHELSIYISLLNSGIAVGKKKKFILQTALGFGSGKVNYDSHNYQDNASHRARFFFGINMKTPYRAKQGGVDVLFDFDGSGFHVGSIIPINQQLDFKAAITNFQNIGNFNTYEEKATKTIFSDATAITFGVGFKFKEQSKPPPKITSQKIKFATEEKDCLLIHTRKEHNNPIAINKACDDYALNQFVVNINEDFVTLHDSIKLIEQEVEHYTLANTAKDYEIKTLQDSINMQYLKQRISKSELNVAMKHISQSLQHYYSGEYILALEEINQTIRRFPDLAIAYARKGSIYYQLGDLQQATINWNLALKHDPEYVEVQQMLLSIKTETEKLSEPFEYNNN